MVHDEADALAFLTPTARRALRCVSTATLTTQLLARGLRNTFLPGLSAANPREHRLLGEAFTLRCIPAREDIDVLSIYQDYDHPQRRAVESIGPGQVLVVDARGKSRAGSLGHILATRVKMRGGAGIVTDGAVRDLRGIESLDLPVFCAGAAATTNLAQHHVVDMQVPIGCAEVPVYPGDIMVADRDGVICIPRKLGEETALAAMEQEDLEEFVLALIEEGHPLRHTYPPGAEVIARYQQERQQRDRDR